MKYAVLFLSQEMVGPFNADYYLVDGMVLESRKRREHLSEEDLKKNRAMRECFTRGQSPVNENREPVRLTKHFYPHYNNHNAYVFCLLF